ncbi:hypothetical protein [Anaerorudis cellulosivorans]|uniref:hypothetical protein n=1 Tax=Anaerorudis cellulosivorans TaxID=3397862 RepID=UPI0022210B31|nr:hypothetical protein [Seramator thermalis]MCW1735107.1 hypothetical protein [Seramator thermalis]
MQHRQSTDVLTTEKVSICDYDPLEAIMKIMMTKYIVTMDEVIFCVYLILKEE